MTSISIPEDGDSMFFRKLGNYLQFHAALQPTKDRHAPSLVTEWNSFLSLFDFHEWSVQEKFVLFGVVD
jgi:hypothetical protein